MKYNFMEIFYKKSTEVASFFLELVWKFN